MQNIYSRFSPEKEIFPGQGNSYIAIFPVGNSTLEKSVIFPGWETARGEGYYSLTKTIQNVSP